MRGSREGVLGCVSSAGCTPKTLLSRPAWYALLVPVLLSCASEGFEQRALDDCRGSCDHQMHFCLGIEAADCYALCELAVEVYAQRRSCLQLARSVWRCDQTAEWRCSPENLTVGEPTDVAVCGVEREALDAAGCNRAE